jgi:hypothetical protein
MPEYGVNIFPIAAAGALVIDSRNAVAVVVRAATGATVTASAVDDSAAGAHTTGAENQLTVAANQWKNLFVELGPHPWFRISSAGAGCRVVVMR